jgi:hypothetical protein
MRIVIEAIAKITGEVAEIALLPQKRMKMILWLWMNNPMTTQYLVAMKLDGVLQKATSKFLIKIDIHPVY